MPVFIIFIVTSLISLLRVTVTNREALSSLVWAEDGLFPLCIAAHGYVQCLFDPYAGYLLFLSRTLAAPVALFPQSTWPLVTNLVAAATFGLLSSLITYLLIRAQVPVRVAVGAGLVTVLLPVVGLETINTAGSAYMLLIVAAAIAVSFTFSPQLPWFVTPLLLFLSAITIPSSVVLVLPLLAALIIYPGEQRKRTLLSIAALVGGLVVQLLVITTATNTRSVEITLQSLKDWVEQFPNALFSLVPTVAKLDELGRLSASFYDPNVWIGLLSLVALSAFAIFLFTRRSSQLRGAGWLLVTGVLIGFIPALAGYPNNRYFVVPIIALVISIFIWMSSVFERQHQAITIVIIALIFLGWFPDFGASQFRATASPAWNQMLTQIQEQCRLDPNSTATFAFSPNWPFEDTMILPPTSNIVNCDIVQKP